ncbi:MAG: YihY/virulence factor BrkB family protein [Solirubrobacterales bacterium]|nr:YihY/virulence factor BrkB family protein [Solirubrobacterales bacterium]
MADQGQAQTQHGRPAGDDVAEPSADGRGRGWWPTLKATFREFQEDNATDWAAALTYYAVLALFPGILVLVSILGLVGQVPQTTDALLDIVAQLGPASAVDTFRGPIEGIIASSGGAGAGLVIGLLGAVWSASGYVGAFFRACDVVWDVEEGRPAWKLVPMRVLVTVVIVLLLAIVLIALVVTGPVAEAVGNVIGLGSTAVTIWNIAKWPVMLVVIMGIIAALYYVSPNVRHPRFAWISPGSVVAVLVWIVASLLFAFYVGNFGSYNATYGALAGVIVFLLWLWITNVALLFGAELNAEVERSRQIARGVPPEQEPFLPPRQPAD